MYLTQLKDQEKKGFKLYFVVVNKYNIYIYTCDAQQFKGWPLAVYKTWTS